MINAAPHQSRTAEQERAFRLAWAALVALSEGKADEVLMICQEMERMCEEKEKRHEA